MRIFDRFTRDRHSRTVWGGATAVFLVLALLALAGEGWELSKQEQTSEDLAVQYTDTVLFDALDANLLAGEIRGRQYRDLIIQVQGGIMTDEGVARVRIWAPDGTLLFSTESLEQIGVAKAVNSTQIQAAVDGQVSSVVSEDTVAAKSGLSGNTQRLFQTFSPIRVRERTTILGVAEIDRTYTSISEAAAQPWRALQIGLGAATLLCALLLILSLRRARSTLDSVGISAPREAAPGEPVPAEANPLRLRNERAVSSLARGGGTSTGEANRNEDTARLAEAEAALAEAGSHADELERALAEARAQAVAPETLTTLEGRVVAAEARAREAELQMQDLAATPPPAAAPPSPKQPPAPVPNQPPTPVPNQPPAPVPTAPIRPATPAPAVEAPAERSEEPTAPEPSPEAMDLRSRLARTAARKKLGSHVDDDPNA